MSYRPSYQAAAPLGPTCGDLFVAGCPASDQLDRARSFLTTRPTAARSGEGATFASDRILHVRVDVSLGDVLGCSRHGSCFYTLLYDHYTVSDAIYYVKSPTDPTVLEGAFS